MPIRGERVSERRVGIDNDGESGCKGLFAGMVIHYTIMHVFLLHVFLFEAPMVVCYHKPS